MTSVFRQDPTTGGWVIMAPGRVARPHATADAPSTEVPRSEACPLCPGNEHETPPEVLRLPSAPGPWSVRVVPNKYAVVSPAAGCQERMAGNLLRELDGAGHHELIIDSRHHDRRFAQLSERERALIWEVYHSRYTALRAAAHVAFIIIFKNSGAAAGASLMHPHSQLVTAPMTPPDLECRFARARTHWERTGRSIYRELAENEARLQERIVAETANFTVFCPFASSVPYEVWIMPKRNHASFGDTTSVERGEAACLLGATLTALDEALDRPAFNYILHTAPVADEDKPYYLWHVRILPRIAVFAGFELGSGIPINTVLPEHAAKHLRETPPF